VTKKHALLITAYRDEPTLTRLLEHFSDDFGREHFRLFVHIDKKSKDISIDRLFGLNIPNLDVFRKYKIYWGSINHIYAVLDMMKMMLNYPDVSYVHVLSGSDMAIHSSKWIYERFQGMSETSFELGDVRMVDRHNKDDWYGHYWLPSTLNPGNFVVRKINGYGNRIQQILHVHRKRIGDVSVEDLRFALIWASYCREACAHIIRFAETHRSFLSALNLTRVPEEAFFGTALVGTKYQATNLVPYLRFAEWSLCRSERPAILDERDYENIYSREYAFIRKIDSVRSKKLIEMLDKEGGK